MPEYAGDPTTYTDAQLLALVRAQIARVLVQGQRYRNPDGSFTELPPLGDLQRQEREILARIQAAETGPARNLATMRRHP